VIALQGLPAEGVLHDPAVMQVLLEVEEHQTAVEERADEVRPGWSASEDLVAVDEDRLESIRPVDGVQLRPEHVHPGHLAVVVAQPLRVTDRVRTQTQQVNEPQLGAGDLAHGVAVDRGHLGSSDNARHVDTKPFQCIIAPCRWRPTPCP